MMINRDFHRRVSDLLTATLSTLFILAGLSSLAHAHELTVKQEVQLKIKPEAAWALLGEYNGLDRWHPAVLSSMLLGTGKDSGDIRVLDLGNDASITEQLNHYNDDTMSYEYTILDSPLPVRNYVSSITVTPAANGASTILWMSTFTGKGASDEKAKEAIEGVYQAGLNSLSELFN